MSIRAGIFEFPSVKAFLDNTELSVSTANILVLCEWSSCSYYNILKRGRFSISQINICIVNSFQGIFILFM
jgi:hypothetical protein